MRKVEITTNADHLTAVFIDADGIAETVQYYDVNHPQSFITLGAESKAWLVNGVSPDNPMDDVNYVGHPCHY